MSASERAVDHVRRCARSEAARSAARIDRAVGRLAAPVDTSAVRRAVAEAPVVLHLHPDRITADGRTVVEGLEAEGRWRTQWETGISAGALAAHPGGVRDGWERDLFGGAYDGSPPSARPAYGALDLLGLPDGPCPRFGSCRLVLAPSVRGRTTLCLGDSHLGPRDLGPPDVPDAIIAGLLEPAEPLAGSAVIGPGVLDVAGVVAHLVATGRWSGPGRVMDAYVEAQVHGRVDLDRDVVGLVVDPSYRGTATGGRLAALAAVHGWTVAWTPGFALDLAEVEEVGAALRGAHVGPLARRVVERVVGARAGEGRDVLDAAALGRADADARSHPAAWSGLGPDGDLAQGLTHIWHVLVLAGRPNGHVRFRA